MHYICPPTPSIPTSSEAMFLSLWGAVLESLISARVVKKFCYILFLQGYI